MIHLYCYNHYTYYVNSDTPPIHRKMSTTTNNQPTATAAANAMIKIIMHSRFTEV